MDAFIRRCLLTACWLVLALPPGWCSFACVPGFQAKQESPKKGHGGCCDMCHCKDRDKPSPEPKYPNPPSRCCCYETDWLKPKPAEKPVVDASLVVFVAPADVGSTCAGVRHNLDPCIPGPSPPLHLLKCVWLC